MWEDIIKYYYEQGYYDEEDVKVFVPSFITEIEYEEITAKTFEVSHGR